MLKIDNNTKTIHMTRGDSGKITLYFDIGRYVIDDYPINLKVYEANHFDEFVFGSQGTGLRSSTSGQAIDFEFFPDDTRTNVPQSNSPITYWYEIEYTEPYSVQTLIGYDELGPKLFIVYPEGYTETTNN